MNYLISSIHYYPVKSLSFFFLYKAVINKDLGFLNDRIFAFSRNLDLEKAISIEEFPEKRKLNNFLTLKNSPILNKYKFSFENNILTLYKNNYKIISISTNNREDFKLLSEKLIKLEPSLLKPIHLLQNKNFPFFDTTHSNNISNSVSLVNLNSIKDLQNKTGKNIEFERFRANIYVDGIKSWEERVWINKIVKINNISFSVKSHISRCSATNLKPNSDEVTLNLPKSLKKYYNHTDLGVYLTPLESGEINIGDKIILDE